MAQSSGDFGAPVAFPNVAGDKDTAASGDTTHGLVEQSGYPADRHVLHPGPRGPGPWCDEDQFCHLATLDSYLNVLPSYSITRNDMI